MSSVNLHGFFLPFLAPGHMIPMVDVAKIFASRGVKVTIITTTANAPLIQPTIDRSPHPINLLIIQTSSSSPQNITGLPTPDLTPEFCNFIDSLHLPFLHLLNQHNPDFLVADVFFTWAVDLPLPRVVFHGSSAIFTVLHSVIWRLKIHETVTDDKQLFTVINTPHHIEFSLTQLMPGLRRPDAATLKLVQSFTRSYGSIYNTFLELEPEYISMIKSKKWAVGPVSLCVNGNDAEIRGGTAGECYERCLKWLDGMRPGSVVYVSFGSLGRFTVAQLREIAVGLEAAGSPFIWVMRGCGDEGDSDSDCEWMPDQGFEKRVKCFFVRGWAPQVLLLGHEGIGGFMTHCGWNSCLEGASVGLPMITWPLFAEQPFNEKLIVDVLRIGVAVGVKACNPIVENRTFVRADHVERAVKELMGDGEEAEGRRRRAKEIADKARSAVEVGGSSYNDMSKLIQELVDLKADKLQSEAQTDCTLCV